MASLEDKLVAASMLLAFDITEKTIPTSLIKTIKAQRAKFKAVYDDKIIHIEATNDAIARIAREKAMKIKTDYAFLYD